MSGLFRTKEGVPIRCLTIDDFVKELRMSRATFYRLKPPPRTFKLTDGALYGTRLIRREDAIKWVEDRLEIADKEDVNDE